MTLFDSRPDPEFSVSDTFGNYSYLEADLGPHIFKDAVKVFKDPVIGGKELLFSWNNMFIRAELARYCFPSVSAYERQYDFSNNPVVQKKVIKPALLEIKLDLELLIPFFERFKKLPKSVLHHPEICYSKNQVGQFDYVYRIFDNTSWGKNTGKGLLRKVGLYRDISKQIVKGDEDLVDIAQNIEMVDKKNFACVVSNKLNKAFEIALNIYEMHKRLRK